MLNLFQDTAAETTESTSISNMSMEQVQQALIDFAPKIGMALLIFIIGWIFSKWAYRLVSGLGKRKTLDTALMRFLGGIAQYLVLAAALIAALGQMGIQTASLLAIMASAGLAIGLALQGSLSNFASGVMILFFRPFNLGDRVKAGGEVGKVDDIGIFTTILMTPHNEKIIIPNSQITGDVIINYTAQGSLRATIGVGVAYGSDVNQVREILLAAANRMELALEDPAPSLFFEGLGASSLDFKVFAWADPDHFVPLQDALRQAIYDDLNAAGIEIPFAQIVVHQAPEA